MLVSDLEVEILANGQASGEVGEALKGAHFDAGFFRPWIDKRGVKRVTINSKQTEVVKDPQGNVVFNSDGTPQERPVYASPQIHDVINMGVNLPCFYGTNATTLRKDEWVKVDERLQKEFRAPLRAWDDLVRTNPMGGFDGMSVSVLEYEKMNDPGEAMQDMDGISEGRVDRPLFTRDAIPLPITHSSFFFTQRALNTSRNRGTPLDIDMGEASARRVGEAIEKNTIGVTAGLQYGVSTELVNTSQVYGYMTHPDRITKSDMTAPDGTNGTTIKTEWLTVRQLLYAQNFFGPYIVYVSDNFDQYLDNRYDTSESSAGTLRENLLKIDGVSAIRRLDFLTTDNVAIWVQMSPSVVQGVVGLPLTTLQWDTKGGMQMNFKVMTIQAPRIKSDYSGRCGVAHTNPA